MKLRYLTIAGIVSSAIGFGLIMSAGYRRIRFLSFLHPWEDVGNTGYQLAQSLIALGSGGLAGVGLGASRQKWQYVPNAHTDFIFSILGEELGLIGEMLVLVAFGGLIYAGIRIAAQATDVFGRLLAGGIVGLVRPPGADQPRRGDGPAADHGRAASVPFLRRILLGGVARGGRHPRERRPIAGSSPSRAGRAKLAGRTRPA